MAGVANATKAVELPKAPGQEDSPPMFLIFHRMGLEQMVEMCCNLAEYRTFSMMMRMRVEQRRWSKMIQEMMAANKAAQELTHLPPPLLLLVLYLLPSQRRCRVLAAVGYFRYY